MRDETISPRNKRLKDMILDAPYEICIERARYYTESYRMTEGLHPAIRAAMAFEHTLKNMSIYILDDEQIVGNRTSKLIAAAIPVERGDINTVLELDLDLLRKRESQPYVISDDEVRELREIILPYWKGKTIRVERRRKMKAAGLIFIPSLRPSTLKALYKSLDFRKMRKIIGLPGRSLSEISDTLVRILPRKIADFKVPFFNPVYAVKGLREVLLNNPAYVMNSFDVQGHLIPGHKNVLREGFSGIRKRAEKRLSDSEFKGDKEGANFLKAVIICCDAMRDFALRYSVEAERLAENANEERRRELLSIAERCRHVPYHPPRDFREALQAFWLTHIAAIISYGMPAILSTGRLDSHFASFYEEDLKKGAITKEQATELMEELLIKLACNLILLPYGGKATGNELGSDNCTPTIGGLNPDGTDGTTEMTYVVLNAAANVKSMGNSFSIRVSEKSPPEYWQRIIDMYRNTSGPALFNDEVVIEALTQTGMRIEDARDYAIVGCVEPTGDGNTFGCTSGNDISLVAALEMALLNGRLRIMGKRIGPATGDPVCFRTFDDFFEAYKKQMSFMISVISRAVNIKDESYRSSLPSPFISCTLTGCIENARDMTSGGAKYTYSSVSGRGLGTAADSLAAIKHFVFDEKVFSMDELVSMLDVNFRGFEKERAMLKNRGPRFGADIDDADFIAAEISSYFCTEVGKQKNIFGTMFRPGFFSYGMHVLDGLFLGATPDGRLSGEPVSNSFSPSNGSETKGPTAVMKSASKMNHTLISNGNALNVKFLPSMITGRERADRMISLFKGYFRLGGMEISPNFISSEMLREAQMRPEMYRDLVVRVSGYSAFFTDLGRPLQDEIISRTEFGGL
ncbi:MAG TPA: pyruvate formate lyase family protein [Desulfomonilia bacterium]